MGNYELAHRDYCKVRSVILSCENVDQLTVAGRMVNQYNKTHKRMLTNLGILMVAKSVTLTT